MKALTGVFDSGLGGLTALRAARALLPEEDFLYLGDTAHLPYGSRPPATLQGYTEKALAFLKKRGAERVLIACGTVSAAVLPRLKAPPLPLFGVIEPAAQMAASLWKGGTVGVLGTEETVKSGAFPAALHRIDPKIRVRQIACPLFVALVECGFSKGEDQTAHFAAAHYLAPFMREMPDVLILGCTHFPLLADVIGSLLPGTPLVNSGEAGAKALAAAFDRGEGGVSKKKKGSVRFFVTDDAPGFAAKAGLFFSEKTPPKAQRVCL